MWMAGFARRYIETEYPDATALFLPGFAGDQNPYPRRELELAKQHGRTIATTVRAAIESPRLSIRGSLRPVFDEQKIEFSDSPSRTELEAMCRADDRYRVRAEALLSEIEESGSIRTNNLYPIRAFGFGDDLTLVGLGGEVLVEYGLQLKERLDGPIWTVGYANAEFTYVPTAQAIYEGGYEGDDVIQQSRFPGPLESEVEDRVLRRVRALAGRVYGNRLIE